MFSASIRTEICHYLRGSCDTTCEFEYIHKWGIPLCSGVGMKCCAPNDVGKYRVIDIWGHVISLKISF